MSLHPLTIAESPTYLRRRQRSSDEHCRCRQGRAGV